MASTTYRKTQLASAIGALVLALGAGQAWGAAFALQEQSGSGLGNAYAGGAAVGEDASTVWSNPAGMSRFSSINIAVAGSMIAPSIKFNNNGSVNAFNQPLGGNGGDAGSVAFLPAMYITIPINNQFAFGLGIGAPFGLKTEWDDGWLGRYQAIKSEIKTINVNPAISWKVNDRFSVGVGLDYQQIDATLTNNVNYSGALAQAAGAAAAAGLITPAQAGAVVASTGGLDANANVDGNDYAWGWNIGVLFNVDENMRIGAHYRSSIKYDVSGNVNFSYPSLAGVPPALAPLVGSLASNVNAVLYSGGVNAQIEVPAIANLSIFAKLNPKWDVMADVQFTQWSSIPELRFVRSSGALLSVTPENFKDAWRVSVGANYQYNDQWKFRGGLAWDQSPVQDAERTPRLPDADRIWIALGAQWAYSKNMKFDLGYAFVSATSAPSESQNAGSTTSYGLIKGDYDAFVNILSLQLTYSF